jgi:two-component system, OmpR family, phosphate regulon sensor histidine kinase PhoR
MSIFKTPIFRRLLLGSCLILAVSFLVLNFYLSRYITEGELQDAQRTLEMSARILAAEVGQVPPSELQSWALRAGARAQARITVISDAGVVLADSEHDPESMENHASRPEIRDAYEGRIGKSIRYSPTLDQDLCYVAMAFSYLGRPRFILRLAVPVKNLHTARATVRGKIITASLLALAAALGMIYPFSRSFTWHIKQLKDFADGLVEGRPLRTSLPAPDDELGDLAVSFKRTGAQLRDLVDRLSLESARREAILASMVEGVLAVDDRLRITFCNDSFAKLIGMNSSNDMKPILEGVPLVDIFRDPEVMGMLSRALEEGNSIKQRLRLTAIDGRWFEVQVSRLTGPPHAGAIAILHDVTDLERLERIRKDFVANVSHELRTPLTSIRGAAETLLEGALEDREHNRHFVEMIRAQSVRLNNITSDLLVLSELESGRPAAPPERVSVLSAVDAALHAIESEARVRGVQLVRERLEEMEVMGDRTRLEQALVNLLDNAVKFNHPGGEVRVQAGPGSVGRARIAVADTGIGIPSQDLSRIFERFYRVDRARSRDVGGTGLGLSIVKHIVERMGGAISVESRLGEGSTFTVNLPLAPA